MKFKNILSFLTSEKKSKYLIMFYSVLNAILFLTICSKSSFLYPFNNWDDPNCFFTVGKGMANGYVPYRDLFEQKGPLLYLLHAITYLISNRTFFGVFLFEILSFSVFLYFTYKIMALYVRKIHVVWAFPLISFVVLSSYVFISGDSAEEFTMPLLAISLYYMLHYYKNIYPNKMPTKELILNGFIAGLVLWIKYNLLGFWFGFALFLCISLLINKKIKDAFLTGVYFLLGMFIATVPWLIYFGINGALYDLFYVYFFVNISSYSSQLNIVDRLIRCFHDANMYAKNLWLFSIITYIGYGYVMISKKCIPNVCGKVALTFSILFMIIGVYFGTNHVYYFLILMTFMILGLVAISKRN